MILENWLGALKVNDACCGNIYAVNVTSVLTKGKGSSAGQYLYARPNPEVHHIPWKHLKAL